MPSCPSTIVDHFQNTVALVFIMACVFIAEYYQFYEMDVVRYIDANLMQYYFNNSSQHTISQIYLKLTKIKSLYVGLFCSEYSFCESANLS